MPEPMNSGDWAEYSRLVLAQLEKNRTEIDEVKGKLESINLDLSYIKSEIKSADKNLTSLINLVRDGNGQYPLVTRTTILENELKALKLDLDKQKQNNKWKWQQTLSIISVLTAITAVLVSLFG